MGDPRDRSGKIQHPIAKMPNVSACHLAYDNQFECNLVRMNCRFRPLWCLACFGVLLACSSQCTFSDPDFQRRLAVAQIQSGGDEIVGVWVSRQMETGGIEVRYTLLFRSDGTGRIRSYQGGAWGGPYVRENPVSWKHEGGGIWTGEIRVAAMRDFPASSFTVKIAGGELLFEYSFTNGLGSVTTIQQVYVSADNKAAVQKELE